MDITIEEIGDKRVISFGDSITLDNITELYEEIKRYIAEEVENQLDFSNVEECDTSGVQLLLSLLRSRNSEGKKIFVSSVSEHIRDTAYGIGVNLDEYLKDKD